MKWEIITCKQYEQPENYSIVGFPKCEYILI